MFKMKKFILCADGFGISKDFNRAVLNGYSSGFVKSASIVANGESFEAAVNEILPECQKLTLGIHLTLPDYNISKLENLIKKNPQVLSDIEKEFRAQIEKVQSVTKIYHINSFGNFHNIPKIFSLICKLAIEYKIPYIRTFREKAYVVPDFKHIINFRYLRNLLAVYKFNRNVKKNNQTLDNYGLKTNSHFIGLRYAGIIDSKALEFGLKALPEEENILVEAAISPCSYLRHLNDNHSLEFKMTQDKILEDTICRMGYDITNHKNI